MEFCETLFPEVWLIAPMCHRDERGFFARTWCEDEFRRRGLSDRFVQANLSYNERAGTLRGMHFQAAPGEEGKLVRCCRGAIFDVVVDIRPDSPQCGRWCGYELNDENRHALYIPPGFAHGFQTLADHAEVFYQMTASYQPAAARGFHYADPDVAIDWPRQVAMISEKDQQLAPFSAFMTPSVL